MPTKSSHKTYPRHKLQKNPKPQYSWMTWEIVYLRSPMDPGQVVNAYAEWLDAFRYLRWIAKPERRPLFHELANKRRYLPPARLGYRSPES